MIVAIHQPNLFPWLGYFNKINKADKFVILDHAEMNPRTAIYPKRVQIIVNKQAYWLTCNLKSEGGRLFYPIDQMIIDKPERLKDKHLKTFELNYKKAPYYDRVMKLVHAFYDHPSEFIAQRNSDFITNVCVLLNIDTKLQKSSELNVKSSSNQMLIDIVKLLEGDCYMPGGGAQGYQVDELFIKNGIKLQTQNFKHPHYPQLHNSVFIPGQSILDTLMNIGFEETEKLIKNA